MKERLVVVGPFESETALVAVGPFESEPALVASSAADEDVA